MHGRHRAHQQVLRTAIHDIFSGQPGVSARKILYEKKCKKSCQLTLGPRKQIAGDLERKEPLGVAAQRNSGAGHGDNNVGIVDARDQREPVRRGVPQRRAVVGTGKRRRGGTRTGTTATHKNKCRRCNSRSAKKGSSRLHITPLKGIKGRNSEEEEKKKKDGRPGTLYLGSERRATVADSSRGRLPVAVSVTAIAAAALRCSSHAAAKVDTRASVSSAETESSTASCAIAEKENVSLNKM
jgi:hypothetical protein